MSAVSNNVQLTLSDGTACSVLFTAGEGVAVSKQGQLCGRIDDAELSEFAARRNGAIELAAQIETMLGGEALDTRSQDILINSGYRWFEQYF